MQIKSQFDQRGKTYNIEYNDGLPPDDDSKIVDAVHAYCFFEDKLVIVKNSGDDTWTPPGGKVEPGESNEEATVREIKEETNMKVLHIECIGYQDVQASGENTKVRQVRMFCITEPEGDFEADPDADVSEIKLIDPSEYKEYIKWLEIGDHLITRALEIKKQLELQA